jgi:hypothetical protein
LAKSGKKVGPVVKSESSIRTIAFIGNYLPRKCGIATFTSDLLQAVAARHPPNAGASRCLINDIDGCYQYPDVVRFEIEEQDLGSYRRAAGFLNSSNVDIVSVQHEFGIFGGPAGSHLIGPAARIESAGRHHAPHRAPQAERRPVSRDAAIDRALNPAGGYDGARADDLAGGLPGASPAKIDLIPHGIPDVAFVASDSITRISSEWAERRCC